MVGSFCQYAFAPPLDILKRGPELKRDEYGGGAKKNKEDGGDGEPVDVGIDKKGRTSRWWVCLSEHKIYFYQFYGDSDPRFIADLSNAVAYFGRDGLSAVTVTFPDRNWVFDFDQREYASRFHFAIEEGRKAIMGSSIIIKKNDILGKTHTLSRFGHTTPLWKYVPIA